MPKENKRKICSNNMLCDVKNIDQEYTPKNPWDY